MLPLFQCNHAGVEHSIKAVAFGWFLPLMGTEWKDNNEICEVFNRNILRYKQDKQVREVSKEVPKEEKTATLAVFSFPH